MTRTIVDQGGPIVHAGVLYRKGRIPTSSVNRGHDQSG
jgi:hypothetical protein